MNSPENPPPSIRCLPLMLPLFVGSGCAALIYEVVWFQVLELVVGASAVSLAVLLGTFMGGMGAGSLLLPRYVSSRRHPLLVYAALEAVIGIAGALLIVVMPLVGQLYTAVDGGGPSSIVLRGFASALLLLPPTMLMGATLPAMARYVKSTPSGVAWMGYFYAGNIAGAVIGGVAAGFYLLRVHDLTTAAMTAVGLNVVVAIASALLAAFAPYTPRTRNGSDTANLSGWRPRGVYVAIGLSGMAALGSEVVWTRLLALLFGATTYAFSIILAVFLLGIGIGSGVGSLIARTTVQARIALAWTQLFLAFAVAYGAWMIVGQLPYWPIDPALAPGLWFGAQVDFARALIAMLPSTLLWGASFPLAVAAVARPDVDDAGRVVGRVYAANTMGAIAGAVLTALVGIPVLGTDGSQQLLILTCIVSSGVAFVPVVRSPIGSVRPHPGTLWTFGTVVVVAIAVTTTVMPVSAGLIAWGRQLPWQGEPRALFAAEGINASVAVTEDFNGWRNFHVSGKVEASTEPQDMRLQRLLGHLSALMHEEGPRSALVVGFGSGVTAGAISLHPTVERLVICELEPLIPEVVSTYFGEVNEDVARNPMVEIVYDDARHYVLTTRETFDVITSDPIHPWVKGAASLYTREYFEHVRARLNPGGVVTQWVPLYESTPESVESVVATFLGVFPNGTIWRNDDVNGRGYDMVLVGTLDAEGSATPRPVDVDRWQARIDRPENAAVRDSLLEVGYADVFDVLGTYSGRASDLSEWIGGAEINTDGNLRLQYLAGIGYNDNFGTEIRDSMLRYLEFPADLFTGSAESVEALRFRIMGEN